MRFNNKNIALPEKIITYYLYDYIHMDATDFGQSKRSYIDLDYVPTLTTNVEILPPKPITKSGLYSSSVSKLF